MTAESLAAAHQAQLDSTTAVDIVALEASNRRFHRALLVPCGMPRLLSSIDDLHAANSRFLLATWQTAGWQPRSDHEHVAILESVSQIGRASCRERVCQYV